MKKFIDLLNMRMKKLIRKLTQVQLPLDPNFVCPICHKNFQIFQINMLTTALELNCNMLIMIFQMVFLIFLYLQLRKPIRLQESQFLV